MKQVAKILLFDAVGHVLVLTRGATHPRFAGHFDLPGGEVEDSEDPATTTVRELVEETKLVVDRLRLKLLFAVQYDSATEHLLYTAALDQKAPQVTLSWEHSAYLWMPYAKFLSQRLPANTDPYYGQAIDFLRKTPSA